ncbi:unnamed protein product [Brachionus calyciflorus]|uniref:Uncharacterized protein n=1 Tax=Brachionus calyciflorus TaxID=104777 RepID=A0A814LNF5_9BILA|nr:unnamed protein product [Brachionus calyciflorus]
MSRQHRHRHQLSHNFLADADSAKNVFDLMLPRKDYKSIKGFIQEIQSNPFGVLLISDIQAKLWALLKEKDPIWYFDATGSIMAKLPNQKETLLFSIVVDSKDKTSISVADFLTSSNDTISIHCYLSKILQKFGLYSFFGKTKGSCDRFFLGELACIIDSPFTKYFEDILKDPIDDNSVIHDLENNSLFFPELFLIIKKKLHLVPLWSGVMLKIKELDQTRLSNNFVEGWFRYFKTKILNINKSVRNCRKLYTNEIATPPFFEIKRKYSKFYEDRFNILYEKTDKQDHYLGDKISTEIYSFRNPKKSTADYYNSNFSFLNNEEDSIKESVKNKKLNDLGISEYFDENYLFDSDFIEDKNNSESDLGEHENFSEMVVDENSSDIPIGKYNKSFRKLQ